MLIRLLGSDLPGTAFGPDTTSPGGHENVHVAVQSRARPPELAGLTPGDRETVRWELPCEVVSAAPLDVRGPHIHGRPGERFIYLTWGDLGPDGTFAMFRRAKLQLDGVPQDVAERAVRDGILQGELGLTDAAGWPLCASVRPPKIRWSAAGN